MKILEEKAKGMELKEDDTPMTEVDSMETEVDVVEQREAECVSCGTWMNTEKRKNSL